MASHSHRGRRRRLRLCRDDACTCAPLRCLTRATQAVRNQSDLATMACPAKYRSMQDFHRYYSGEKRAPVLTIFIGGNHEASSHLWELYYGGWVAPNIYFLGYAGVVSVGGVRIGGLSGIYNGRHYHTGHCEAPPYSDSDMRSAYHVREIEAPHTTTSHPTTSHTTLPHRPPTPRLSRTPSPPTAAPPLRTPTPARPKVLRLLQLRLPMDVFLSHDWPAHIATMGDTNALLRKKSFLRDEVRDGSLGSPAGEQPLERPRRSCRGLPPKLLGPFLQASSCSSTSSPTTGSRRTCTSSSRRWCSTPPERAPLASSPSTSASRSATLCRPRTDPLNPDPSRPRTSRPRPPNPVPPGCSAPAAALRS